MAAAIERNAPLPHFQIEEDSAVWKALSCVPLLGWIPAFIQLSSLRNKINQEVVRPGGIRRSIELYKVSNNYIKASVVNGLLSIAIAVSLLYFGIFIMIGAPLLSIGVPCVTVAWYVIYTTKEHLKELQPIMREREDLEIRLKDQLRVLEDLERQMEYELRRAEDLRGEDEALSRQEEDLLIQLGHVVN